MKTPLLTFLATLLLPAAALAGTDKLNVSSDGSFEFDGLPFVVRHYDSNWMNIDQTAMSKDGSPETTDNTTIYKGTIPLKEKGMKLEEKLEQVDSKTIKVKYTITLEPGTSTNGVVVLVTVPVEKWIGKNIQADGETVTMPQTLPEKWQLMGKKTNKLTLPSTSGTLVIDCEDVWVSMQDDRQWQQPNFELRLTFPTETNVAEAGGTASFSFTITANPATP